MCVLLDKLAYLYFYYLTVYVPKLVNIRPIRPNPVMEGIRVWERCKTDGVVPVCYGKGRPLTDLNSDVL